MATLRCVSSLLVVLLFIALVLLGVTLGSRPTPAFGSPLASPPRSTHVSRPASSPVVLFSEDFDSVTAPSLPTNWAWAPVIVTSAELSATWKSEALTMHPLEIKVHSPPNLATLNSYDALAEQSARLYRTTGVNLSGAATAAVTFWMYHNPEQPGTADRIQVQVSTDLGATWVPYGPEFMRIDGSTAWKVHLVDITAAAGASDVRIGFLGTSGWGDDMHIDDVSVLSGTTNLFLPAIKRNFP